MFNLVSLLAAAALVSLQCGFEANALLDNKHLDNEIKVNMIPSAKRRASKILSITQAPPESARLAGAPLPLYCEALGAPAPTVRWLKNGEPLSDYLDESNEITTVYPSSMAWLGSTLVVTNAANGDEFTCVASNGITSETATTTVYAEPGENNELLRLSLFTAPVITLYYEQLFQEIGSNVVLPCRVTSASEPQVYWQDSNNNVVYGNSRMRLRFTAWVGPKTSLSRGTPLPPAKGFTSASDPQEYWQDNHNNVVYGNSRVLPSGDLFIAGIRWSDLGEYTCIAKNLYGTTEAVTFLYPAKPGHVRQKLQ